MTEATDNGRLAYMFAEMLNTKDVDLVDGFVAEGYVNHNPYVEDGPEANKRFWAYWLSAFPDTEVTVEDVVAAGDRVVGRFTYRATHAGEFMGVGPTGECIEMRSIDVWRVEDGKFVEHWDELGGLEFLMGRAGAGQGES